MTTSPKVQEALDFVRKQIEALVREEQLKDHVTGLGNGFALDEWLEKEIEDNKQFWCALIELDHFKRVNDAIGYENADLLLQKVGKRLQLLEDYVGQILPIRAHGDEFYAAGEIRSERDLAPVEQALGQLRIEIRSIRVVVKSHAAGCTASIGWATSSDVGTEVLTPRRMKQILETATREAKFRGRDNVVRYEPSQQATGGRDFRDKCGKCRSTFTVDVPAAHVSSDDLYCPNCGNRVARPSEDAAPPGEQP